MRVNAATVSSPGAPWEVREVELRTDLAPGDVLVRVVAAGLCHSDEHLRMGSLPIAYPFVGGHEGSGVVVAVGSMVGTLIPGDRVVFAFRPACGQCRYCVRGSSNLCLETMRIFQDASHSYFSNGIEHFTATSLIGSFASHTVVPEISCIKVPEQTPLEVAALLGCAVPTGFSAMERAGEIQAAETALVVGAGGVGINAIQAASINGAAEVLVVDNAASRESIARDFGATQFFTTVEEVQSYIEDTRGGIGVDVAVVTVGVPGMVEQVIPLMDRGGRVVLTALGDPAKLRLEYPIAALVKDDITVRGSIAGSSNLRADVPRYIALYEAGLLKLDELVTKRYQLSEIEAGYADMHEGRSIRGIVVFNVQE